MSQNQMYLCLNAKKNDKPKVKKWFCNLIQARIIDFLWLVKSLFIYQHMQLTVNKWVVDSFIALVRKIL